MKSKVEIIEADTCTPEQARRVRGLDIAQRFKLEKTENGNWIVPSQYGSGVYVVTMDIWGHTKDCTCPDFEKRQRTCKHMFAVETIIYEYLDDVGDKQLVINRKSYGQDWAKYDFAQINEKHFFMKLLNDLCSTIQNPEYKFGRPSMPLNEMVFSSALKVYTTFSLRRFMTDMNEAKEKGYIQKVPYYSTVARYMEKEEMTKILMELIKKSSLPLASIENDFAVDSSGFSSTRFARYFSFKHEKELKYKDWLKCHLICGVKTNTVTSVRITDNNDNDCPYLEPLVDETSENFNIKEVSADKAYSSRKNLDIVASHGGTAFIPFKCNANPRSKGYYQWNKMYHLFMSKREEFDGHYHKRSNVETVFHMIKSKFGDSVKSKTKTAQVNEVLLKIVCHNLTVLIQEMIGLGIDVELMK